jgi:hypothetical protein
MATRLEVGQQVTINEPPALRGLSGKVTRTNGGKHVDIETDMGVTVTLLESNVTVTDD